MAPSRVLWYFADPMCSWCWGFAPVITALAETYAERMRLVLMMGGLRPGTTEPVTADFRDRILHHWHDVHARSGQPFKFEGAMPEGFIYDTEPACRAVVTVHELRREAAFAYFKSIQQAFYAAGEDVTQAAALALLAARQGVAAEQFLERFDTLEMKQRTHAQFRQTAEIGIGGFPTVILQNESRYALLTQGFRPFDELKPHVDAWLAETEPAA